MRNPYEVLGVKADADEAQIKSAYRRLAKSLHPDLRPDEADAETQFQELQSAYRILKDPAARRRFDMGFVDAEGNPRSSPFEEALRQAAWREVYENGRKPARGQRGRPSSSDSYGPERDEVLSDFVSTLKWKRRGIVKDTVPITISFEEAIRGARRTIELPGGALAAVTIPPGAENGQVIRLRNINLKSDGQSEGDLTKTIDVEVTVVPDPRFQRDGLDLISSVPITLPEAVLGAQIRVPLPGGALKVTVPPGSNTGTILKLKGQGVRLPDGTCGNLRLELKIMLPPTIDPDFEAMVRGWSKIQPYEVRG